MKRNKNLHDRASVAKSKPKKVDAELLPTPDYSFIYITLKNFANLPEEFGNLEIGVHHSTGVTKLKKFCQDDNPNIEINKLDYYNPEFVIKLNTNSIDNINQFSNEPLLITLYEHIKPHPKCVYMPMEVSFEELSEMEELICEDEVVEEELKILAQGFIDILPYYSKYAIDTDLEIFISSIDLLKYPLKVVKTVWHLKSPLPLQKHMEISNVAFISMESIYNAPQGLLSLGPDLTVRLSFESKEPLKSFFQGSKRKSKQKLEEDMFFKKPLVEFTYFENCLLAEQHSRMKWECLKHRSMNNLGCLGVQSKISVKTVQPFEDLLCTENVDFKLNEIDPRTSMVISANSLIRFALTKDICTTLEDIIAFNEYHILVEVFANENPYETLYEGYVELNIILYPQVYAQRFAVELVPKLRKSVSRKISSRKTPEKIEIPDKPMFIILGLCFKTPITGYKPDPFLVDETLCIQPFVLDPAPDVATLCSKLYYQFDLLIRELVDIIVNENVLRLADAPKHFCDYLPQVRNILSGIIACNYNLKQRTNTNLEFSRLLTTVYNDIENQLFNMVHFCQDKAGACHTTAHPEKYIALMLSIVKYCKDCKQTELAYILYNKVYANYGKIYTHNLSFFKFVDDVELENWTEACEYLKSPPKDMFYDKQRHLMGTYVNYRVAKKTSETEGTTKLIFSLSGYLKYNRTDINVWILLYAIYKSYSYLPGMEYARCKFENLYDEKQPESIVMAMSRWQMLNAYVPPMKSKRMQHFMNALQYFANYGLYEYALFIFGLMTEECSAIETYIMQNTLLILMHEIPDKFETKRFSTDKQMTVELLAALSHVNGHIELERENPLPAMRFYSKLLEMPTLNSADFKLGILRFAYFMLHENCLKEARQAFEMFCDGQLDNLLAHFGMGRTLYFLNHLQHAETHMAMITKFRLHIPDVWAYIALINLRLGQNYKALEFWKYARLHPEQKICEEVLKELNKIDIKKLNFYVDKPQ